ncbi:hypothetical protein EG864_15395, partial [Enterococcus faecalis]
QHGERKRAQRGIFDRTMIATHAVDRNGDTHRHLACYLLFEDWSRKKGGAGAKRHAPPSIPGA